MGGNRYSHCIHNSIVLGLRASGMMHCGPLLELLGFCSPLGQFNGVQKKCQSGLYIKGCPLMRVNLNKNYEIA